MLIWACSHKNKFFDRQTSNNSHQLLGPVVNLAIFHFANMMSFIEIGPGFWNLRSSFTFAEGFNEDLGTHMSVLRLSSGRMLIIDTCDVSETARQQIDVITCNGALIDGVVTTHPYHTTYFSMFHKMYPNTKYYGTPRHIRTISSIPWAGNIMDADVCDKWESEGVSIRIPEGVGIDSGAFFMSAFVFHK